MRRVFITVAALICLSATSVAAKDRKPVVTVAEVKDLTGFGEEVALGAMIETALAGSDKFKLEPRPTNATKPPSTRDAMARSDFVIYVTMTHDVSRSRADIGATLGRAIVGGLLGSRRDGEKAQAPEPCEGCSAAEISARSARIGADAPTACRQARHALQVDVRIVESRSGQVKWADTIRVNRYSCAGTRQARSAAHLRHVTDHVVREMTLVTHPIRVAGIQASGSILLNYGEGMLRVGDTLKLFVPSTQCLVADPGSGQCMSHGVSELGFVQVIEVMPRFSRASPVTQMTDPPPVGAIARTAPLPRSAKKRAAP